MFQKGQKFLEDNIKLINDTYTLSVACYTFTLLQHNITDNLLNRMHIPMRTDEKESDWQNSQSSSVPSPFDWLYDREKRVSDDEKRDLISSNKLKITNIILKVHVNLTLYESLTTLCKDVNGQFT